MKALKILLMIICCTAFAVFMFSFFTGRPEVIASLGITLGVAVVFKLLEKLNHDN